MVPFDFQLRTRIIYGAGEIKRLGERAKDLGASRALVVSDPGIISAGHTGHGIEALESAGIETAIFDGVHENPTTTEVDAGVAFANEFKPDLLVGLGGGSSMDCAKGINFLLTNGGQMKDYWGKGKATQEMLPMIAVPTTSGTGSETQSFALISDPDSHVKMACGDKKASCAIALLDPELTVSQPAMVTAVTGIDAIAHAVETYVTNVRTRISLAFSLDAWRLCHENFPRVLAEPENLEARGGMQLGACLAGVAIENSMLGATHACANPLTARYNVVHGQAIAVMLPHVVRYNGAEFDDWYKQLHPGGSAALADDLLALVEQAGLKTRLGDLGAEENALPQLAEDAAAQWTGGFNPRKVGAGELLTLYQSAY